MRPHALQDKAKQFGKDFGFTIAHEIPGQMIYFRGCTIAILPLARHS